MDIDEAEEAAEALLATVMKTMTGRELQACRDAKSGELREELKALADFLSMVDDDDQKDAAEAYAGPSDQMELIELLLIQCSREIADWINKRNKARSRRATV